MAHKPQWVDLNPGPSQRDRYRAGELLRTAALLALSLTIMLWAAVYFKRASNEEEPAKKPSQPKNTAREKLESTQQAFSPSADDQSSPEASPTAVATAPSDDKKEPEEQGKSDPTGDLIDVMMSMVAIFSTLATGLITLFFCRDLERAFPNIADGLILSSLLCTVAFFLGSMLLRWHNFFEWVFWAYASAAVGYFVELRFRYCNHLIDYIVGL